MSSITGLMYVPRELRKKINKTCPPARPLIFRDGEIIFAQNDQALNQYRITRGGVTVHVGHLLKKVATLGVNDIFGTLGPASPQKRRTATVVALGETHLLVRPLEVDHHTSFNKSDSARPAAAFTVEEKVYKKDDVIVKQGTTGKSFFVIQRGSVNVTVNVDNDSHETETVNSLESGMIFGEQGVCNADHKRTANIVASSDVKLLACTPQLNKTEEDGIQGMLQRLNKKNKLRMKEHEERKNTPGGKAAAAPAAATAVINWGGWGKRPSAAGPDEEGPAGSSAQDLARRQVLASAVRVRAPRNITSSVGDGAEGRAVRAANRAHQELQEERQPLEKDSWVFYKAKYDCCEDKSCGGCHIPFLLGQLVGDLIS
jgi:CRP-like cAMP-binding protein